ncbi:hypothetical protein EBT31_06040 [bacterium]|nr:hypothetical protein [bacterium]
MQTEDIGPFTLLDVHEDAEFCTVFLRARDELVEDLFLALMRASSAEGFQVRPSKEYYMKEGSPFYRYRIDIEGDFPAGLSAMRTHMVQNTPNPSKGPHRPTPPPPERPNIPVRTTQPPAQLRSSGADVIEVPYATGTVTYAPSRVRVVGRFSDSNDSSNTVEITSYPITTILGYGPIRPPRTEAEGTVVGLQRGGSPYAKPLGSGGERLV